LRFCLKFPGFTFNSAESSLLIPGPGFCTRLEVDPFEGVGGTVESGRGRSSKEKIDRSSPFHWSPK
jgi:hypothetical protein